jgi:hypothetical protein
MSKYSAAISADLTSFYTIFHLLCVLEQEMGLRFIYLFETKLSIMILNWKKQSILNDIFYFLF